MSDRKTLGMTGPLSLIIAATGVRSTPGDRKSENPFADRFCDGKYADEEERKRARE